MGGERAVGEPMVVLPAPPTAKAPDARFTGDVWVDGINGGQAPGCARLATVRFAPGARTAWHSHAYGQTLHVTSGRGLVQSADGRVIVMAPGDTVYTPPGTWHWHGAMPASFMSHLALADSSPEPGVADVEWGSHVTDEEYHRATTDPGTGEAGL